MADIEEALGEIKTSLARMEERQVSFLRELADHKITLYGGNGNDGLQNRVQKLETDSHARPVTADVYQVISEHRSRMACKPSNPGLDAAWKILVNVISAIIIGVAAWMLGLFKAIK